MSQTCSFHATHDADGEPTGPACGAPATHMLVWHTAPRRWSPCCEEHSTEVDPEAPPHEIRELRV